MFNRMTQAVFCGCLLLFAPTIGLGSIVYDLNSDWSDAINPNGAWSYQQGNTLNVYTSNWTLGPWAVPQEAWEGSDPQVWFQSNGEELFPHDWMPGDIITHSGNSSDFSDGSVVAWTSPSDGMVDLSGEIWKTRDNDRSNDWSIFHNGMWLTGGVVASGDLYTRATPFDFATGSGGAGVLQNIAVLAGDVVTLRVIKGGASPFGDFAGVNLAIDLTPSVSAVPEPASLTLVGLGAVGMAVGAYRRRRNAARKPASADGLVRV